MKSKFYSNNPDYDAAMMLNFRGGFEDIICIQRIVEGILHAWKMQSHGYMTVEGEFINEFVDYQLTLITGIC